jgi:hypothetical protein
VVTATVSIFITFPPPSPTYADATVKSYSEQQQLAEIQSTKDVVLTALQDAIQTGRFLTMSKAYNKRHGLTGSPKSPRVVV